VAILGSVAVTQLQPSIEKYRLVSSANMIASEMNAGRALAISRSWAYEAQFDTGANTIQVVDPTNSSNHPRMAKNLEPGISFSTVPSPSIRFHARGHALTGVIQLQNAAGETASIIVTPHSVNVIL
jgi:Tfp pilus assembly protein FimT